MSQKKKSNKTNKVENVNMDSGPLLINTAHYIKDLSFENPGILKDIGDESQAPALNVNINVDVSALAENVYEVLILLTAKATRAETPLFLIELVYGGIFQVDPSCNEDVRKRLLLVEAASLLFPFARSVAANLTRDGGFPPLLLNPVNFEALYQQTVQAEETKH